MAKRNGENPDGKDSRRKKAKLRNSLEADRELMEPLLKPRKPSANTGKRDSELLLDEDEASKDIKLTQMAVKRGWNVKSKGKLRRRLERIAMKEKANVHTKDGTVKCETAADKIAIDAIKVLVQMDAQDQTRILKDKPLEANKTEVNVNVTLDTRQAQILELAKSLGARELTIDSEIVPVIGGGEETNRNDSIGTVDLSESGEVDSSNS